MNAAPLLRRIARALTECRLEAVLIGNAAAALQGAPVTTLDFDFLFRTSPTNIRKLKVFADSYHAKPGWHFLAGSKENVQLVLRKIGQFVEARDNHSTILILGNERTGLWKKAFGLAKASDLIGVVESVLDDTGEARQDGAK